MQKGIVLKKGIGIIVTSSPLSRERTDLGLKTIENLGLNYSVSLSPSKYYADYKYGFTNGSKEERLASITQELDNSNVQCLLASRGGAGALDIIEGLPIEKIAKERKMIVGQSDLTSILLQAVHRAKVPAIFGPTLGADFASFNDSIEAKESVLELIQVLTDPSYRICISGEGLGDLKDTEGMLIGGNLSNLLSLLGTPYDVPYEDCILVIEEVGEAPHRIDRMLSQLLISGKLSNVKAICFGRFSRCESKVGPKVDDVLSMFYKKLQSINPCPVIKNLPFGHWGKSTPLPLGVSAGIRDNSLVTLESPI